LETEWDAGLQKDGSLDDLESSSPESVENPSEWRHRKARSDSVSSESSKKSVRFKEITLGEGHATSLTTDSIDSNPSGSPLSPRSALKSECKSFDFELVVQYDKKKQGLLDRLKQGDLVLKVADAGKTRARFMWLSPDGSEILWKKVSIAARVIKDQPRSLPIASVIRLVIGPRTPNFIKYDWVTGNPANCMSMVSDERTLDLEFASRAQMMKWIEGIHMAGAMSKPLSRAKASWLRFSCKLSQISLSTGVCTAELWAELLSLIRKGDPSQCLEQIKVKFPELKKVGALNLKDQD